MVHSEDTTTRIIAPVPDLHRALIQHFVREWWESVCGTIQRVAQTAFRKIDTMISNLKGRSKICFSSLLLICLFATLIKYNPLSIALAAHHAMNESQQPKTDLVSNWLLLLYASSPLDHPPPSPPLLFYIYKLSPTFHHTHLFIFTVAKKCTAHTCHTCGPRAAYLLHHHLLLPTVPH